MKRALILWMACVLFGIGIGSVVSACEFCRLSLAQQQGVDQVANKFGGDINDFRKLYAIGHERNRQIVLPAGNDLSWTVGTDGWVSSAFRSNIPLSGRQVVARLNGELIALFYPDDKSFLFAVLDKPRPVQSSPTNLVGKRNTRSSATKIISSKSAYAPLDREIYIPPTH